MTSVALRHRLEYLFVLSLRGATRWLPYGWATGIGAAIGLLAYALDAKHRRLAVQQLRAAFPRRSDAECRAIARATFAHFGRLLVAVLRFSTMSQDAIRRRVEFEGDDRVRAALSAGKGAIVVTGHFGFWELGGLAHPLALPPFNVLARPIDNPHLHALLERMRMATGNRVIYKQGALRRVIRALENNETVAVLIDQYSHGAEAVTVDYFSQPAGTNAAIAALSLRTGAPLVPAFALPLPGGRYRMVYEPPIEAPPADTPDPVRELTQRCTDVLEMYVRRHPHLWLWMHRRWRDTPVGEPARAARADEFFAQQTPEEGD